MEEKLKREMVEIIAAYKRGDSIAGISKRYPSWNVSAVLRVNQVPTKTKARRVDEA